MNKQTIWSIDFPQTPIGEEFICVYYEQKSQYYVKLTRKDKILFKYYWDGFSASFEKPEINYILD